MKKLALLTTLFISSLFFSLQSSAQTSGNGYLIIKTYESIDMRFNKIIVTENGKKLEEIDLSRGNMLTASEANQILINNAFDKYKAKGYKLVQASSGSQIIGSPTDVLMTTYIFEKQ
jgi:hypothetical protein